MLVEKYIVMKMPEYSNYKKHLILATAKVEAMRLALIHKDTQFVVLSLKGKARVQNVIWEDASS